MTPEEIIERYESICYSCERARRVASDVNEGLGYVGCSIRALPLTERLSEDDIYDAEIIAEGWVDLRSRPFGESSSIITNCQIVTLGVKHCGGYRNKQQLNHK